MNTLRAVAVEGGVVVATAADGTEFHVVIDDGLRARLRDAVPSAAAGRKLSPREIQAHIRAGMSAEEVAAITGAPIDYIQRYEGPVVAEREYVVESALGVPVATFDEPDPELPPPTFGGVIAERLLRLSARGTHWASWKEESGGWVLKLSFNADDIDHDARWRFDPKKLTLSPLNAEAVALSQQGEIGSTLLPRLRAVPSEPSGRDTSRFDSSAFQLPIEEIAPEPTRTSSIPTQPAAHHEPIAYGRGRVMEPRTGAVSISPDRSGIETGETADLLEALRRRRGEREAASAAEVRHEPAAETPAQRTATIRVLERPAASPAKTGPDRREPAKAPREQVPSREARTPSSETVPVKPARRGRTAMPTWDEIVFGARPDDEA
jgi:hypothetical protein